MVPERGRLPAVLAIGSPPPVGGEGAKSWRRPLTRSAPGFQPGAEREERDAGDDLTAENDAIEVERGLPAELTVAQHVGTDRTGSHAPAGTRSGARTGGRPIGCRLGHASPSGRCLRAARR